MAGTTKEVRTIMYSVVNGNVVTHKLPFNAEDAFGLQKLMKFQARGFTFDDPRNKADTGISLPQVIVTQEVDLGKPIDLDSDTEEIVAEETEVPAVQVSKPKPKKKATRGRPRKAKQASGGVR